MIYYVKCITENGRDNYKINAENQNKALLLAMKNFSTDGKVAVGKYFVTPIK